MDGMGHCFVSNKTDIFCDFHHVIWKPSCSFFLFLCVCVSVWRGGVLLGHGKKSLIEIPSREGPNKNTQTLSESLKNIPGPRCIAHVSPPSTVACMWHVLMLLEEKTNNPRMYKPTGQYLHFLGRCLEKVNQQYLVGGFNPSKTYLISQIASFPQGSGWTWHTYLSCHHLKQCWYLYIMVMIIPSDPKYTGFLLRICSWQSFVPFLGWWKRDPFRR